MEVDEDAPQGSDRWVQQHTGIISASLGPRIFGVDQYKRALDLWHLMAVLGKCPFNKDDKSEATEAGHANEGPIAQESLPIIVALESFDATRVRVRTPKMFVHRVLPWLAASADRLVQVFNARTKQWEDVRPYLIIECKFKMGGQLPSMPEVPHLFQVTHQMGVMGGARRMSHCYLSYGARNALTNKLHVFVYKVYYSPELWVWMVERLTEFHDAVVSKKALDWGSDTRPASVFVAVERYWTIMWTSKSDQDRENRMPRLHEYLKRAFRDGWMRVLEDLPPPPRWEFVGPKAPSVEQEESPVSSPPDD